MRKNLRWLAICAVALAVGGIARADTFGNTSPFETVSDHAPNFVLGVRVNVPYAISLQSFGMIYGLTADPLDSNAIFGLYSSGGDGLPAVRQAVTNPIFLSAAATYDNIPFTTTSDIPAGTYWMMALYESEANPRMSLEDGSSLVAYWANPYANGMPANSPGNITYTGQNFNYWVNGTPVPEPARLAVLGLGAFALLRRANSKGQVQRGQFKG